MKKLISILLILIVNVSVLNASSIKGLGELLTTVIRIASTQMGMDLKMVEDGIKQAESLKNQAEMIQYEVQNLKNLGQDISDGNIRSINNFLKQIENTKSNSLSILNNQSKLLNQYRDIYKSSPKEFTEITGYNAESLDALKRQVTRAKDQTNYMLFDAVTQAGYSAKLNNDTHNLNSLLEASKTTKGALEVLQVTNNILGTQQTTLLEIRQLLETSLKLTASIESNKNTADSAAEVTYEAALEEMNNQNEVDLKKMKESMDKDIKFGR